MMLGTLFLELWKRKSNRLAYVWDVQEFEANEPDRPEFFGTTTRTVGFINFNIHIYKFITKATIERH